MSDSETERGQALLSQLIAGEGDPNAIANELLRTFFRGFPVKNLSPILASSDPALTKIAAWIASELGYRARPVLAEAAVLLRSGTSYARFFTLDTVLVCAGELDEEILADAVQLIDDPEASVRWKAVHFLTRLSTGQLEAALRGLAASGASDSALVDGLRNLISASFGNQDVLNLLASASVTLKRIGVAAAVRRSTEDESTLRAAANSADEEIAGMAREELEVKAREKARLEELSRRS